MFAYCGNNPVNFYDPTGEIGVLATLVGIGTLLTVLFVPSSSDQSFELKRAAKEKYNKDTVNVYMSGEGISDHTKVNAMAYIANSEKNYLNISIDKSLEISNQYEMNAVLDVIIESDIYSEEVFGSRSFMRAQWIAHNVSYKVAASSNFGFRFMQFLSGSSNPIESSSSLDIRQTDNMLKRQRIQYTVISWFY